MTSAEELQLAIHAALDAPPIDWAYRDLDSAGEAGCCVCGDYLSLGSPGEVQFGPNATLPIHKECHIARDGLSSKACRLSMIGYSFLVRASMAPKDTTPKGWRKTFLEAFLQEHGRTAGTWLIGYGVPWWERSAGFTSLDEFVRWSRWCFIYERDPGKFTSMGKEIPHWDEEQESWREYIACGHSKQVYGTFYSALYREPRTTRGKTPKCDSRILARTAGRCGLCHDTILTDGPRGKFSGVSDHIFPDSKGGLESIENIQPAHVCCNSSKSSISGGHAPLAWMLGRFALEQLALPDGFSNWKSLAGEAVKATRKFADRF
ncbi:MAG: HNH endonuclease [Phycisphaerales bacterium]|nr:HNH endonuclease [Phycisphaerales bacterium]